MTTPSRRAFVSLAALTCTLVLGACVRSPSPVVSGAATHSVAIRFDNLSREHVHVYLIGLKREWMLGRVEPGAVRSLGIPEQALTGETSLVRLAVIAGQSVTLAAAQHSGAKLTLAQPISSLASQQWRLSQNELTPLAPSP